MLEIRNRRMIVTGASSGIGLDAAHLLHEAGAEVCLVARRGELLAEVSAELGDRAWWYACDVSDAGQVEGLAEAVKARWGGVDGLVNNAGIAPMATLEDTDPAAWDRVFEINVRGPYLLCRALGPGAARQGCPPDDPRCGRNPAGPKRWRILISGGVGNPYDSIRMGIDP